MLRRPIQRVRTLVALAVFSVSMVVGSLAASPAAADVYFYSYIRSDAAGSDKDPINLLFTGDGTLTKTVNEFVAHMAWNDTGGSTMKFQDHGSWEDHQAQRASFCGACTRDHIRFNQSNDSGPAGYSTFTIAAAHYEVFVWCIHSSRSFNDPRNVIEDAFDNYIDHPTVWTYWGNTASSSQCDGVNTSGDGWLVRVGIP